MAAVVFNPAAFKAAYPEFSAVPDATLNGYFVRSQLFLANQDCPVQDEDKRLQLFWLLVAPKPRRSRLKSGLPSRLWRPYTPPILRIA